MKPLLLDLFCCEGGAAMGYHRAGFDVIGVDIDPQPNYPFEFHQGDALEWLTDLRTKQWREGVYLDLVTVVHASPPCQPYSVSTVMHDKSKYPDLVGPTRELLMESSLPWIMENVPGAPLVEVGQMTFDGRSAFMLCGSMFGMRRLQRHRVFETNTAITAPGRCRHEEQSDVMTIVGHGEQGRSGRVGEYWGLAARREVMGMLWASREGLPEAIPPAYTEFIGAQLMQHVRAVA